MIFSGFLPENMEKCRKKVKNDEKGSYIAEKSHNCWKIREIILFGFFQEGMEKCRKKWKMMKKGAPVLLKKAKIDEK